MGDTRTRRSSRSRSTRASSRNASGSAAGDAAKDTGQAPETATRVRRPRHARETTEAPAPPPPPVRVPPALRVGPRRAVGPLIGAVLAAELLESHQPDVLLTDRCECGGAYPCRSRRFAAGFAVQDPVIAGVPQAVPAEDAGLGGRGAIYTVPAKPSANGAVVDAGTEAAVVDEAPVVDEAAGGDEAVEAEGETEPSALVEKPARGRTARGGRRPAPRHAGSDGEPSPPVDMDATQQLPKIPADPPVAVAV